MITKDSTHNLLVDCLLKMGKSFEVAQNNSVVMASLLALIEEELKARHGMVCTLKYAMRDWRTLNNHIWYSLPRKVIVTDLDETLWRGVLTEGDVIKPDLPYQDWLLEQYRNGVLLAISSHNDLDVIKPRFEAYSPRLDWDYFTVVKIDHSPKQGHIYDICQELNMSPSAVVFIDDQSYNLRSVKAAWPEVLTVYPSQYPLLNCFTEDGTDEDIKRSDMYQAEELRQELMTADNWKRELELKVSIEPLLPRSKESERALQLLNKANQMNLSTKRRNKVEMYNDLVSFNYDWWIVRAEDKFGDYGIIGVISVAVHKVMDFVLSCRAMGRGIEDVMARHAITNCWGNPVFMCYPTELNRPMQEFADRVARYGIPEIPDWIEYAA